MNHRVKNLFAIVSGMIGLSARAARTPQEMAQSLHGRLNALIRANDPVWTLSHYEALASDTVFLKVFSNTLYTALIVTPDPATDSARPREIASCAVLVMP